MNKMLNIKHKCEFPFNFVKRVEDSDHDEIVNLNVQPMQLKYNIQLVDMYKLHV